MYRELSLARVHVYVKSLFPQNPAKLSQPKPVLCQSEQQRPWAVWSVPLLFASWIVCHRQLIQVKFQDRLDDCHLQLIQVKFQEWLDDCHLQLIQVKFQDRLDDCHLQLIQVKFQDRLDDCHLQLIQVKFHDRLDDCHLQLIQVKFQDRLDNLIAYLRRLVFSWRGSNGGLPEMYKTLRIWSNWKCNGKVF